MGFLLLHKRIFQVLWVLFALTCLGVVLLFRTELVSLGWVTSRIRLASLGIPFFLFMIVHLILMYQAWIQGKNRTILRNVMLIFICILSCAFALILVGLFISFLI